MDKSLEFLKFKIVHEANGTTVNFPVIKPGTRIEVIASNTYSNRDVGRKGIVMRKTRYWAMYEIMFDDSKSSDTESVEPAKLRIINDPKNAPAPKEE